MNLTKKIKPIYSLLIFILIYTVVITIISLIFYINKSTNQLLNLISIIMYSLITSIKKGLNIEEKAYKEGLKLGLINITTLYILSFLTGNIKITLKRILYYLIIIIISILGCIIGLNKKDTN